MKQFSNNIVEFVFGKSAIVSCLNAGAFVLNACKAKGDTPYLLRAAYISDGYVHLGCCQV